MRTCGAAAGWTCPPPTHRGGARFPLPCQISLLEIYNENVYDLLAGSHQQSLRIRMDEKTGLSYVENAIIRPVTKMEDVTEVRPGGCKEKEGAKGADGIHRRVSSCGPLLTRVLLLLCPTLQALAEGDKNRSVAATAMNIHSSRSHLLLQLTISGVNKITGVTSKVGAEARVCAPDPACAVLNSRRMGLGSCFRPGPRRSSSAHLWVPFFLCVSRANSRCATWLVPSVWARARRQVCAARRGDG